MSWSRIVETMAPEPTSPSLQIRPTRTMANSDERLRCSRHDPAASGRVMNAPWHPTKGWDRWRGPDAPILEFGASAEQDLQTVPRGADHEIAGVKSPDRIHWPCPTSADPFRRSQGRQRPPILSAAAMSTVDNPIQRGWPNSRHPQVSSAHIWGGRGKIGIAAAMMSR